MTLIPVPDIPGPEATLCWKQKTDPPHMMTRCDRRKGHGGKHTWELVVEIERLTETLADAGVPRGDDHA